MIFVHKIGRFIIYFLIFTKELILANFQVTLAVLSPRLNFKPAAIKFKSKMKTKFEMVLITNSITLTPGTLVMDADLKKGEILIHVMSGKSAQKIKEELNIFPESSALWVTRGRKKS